MCCLAEDRERDTHTRNELDGGDLEVHAGGRGVLPPGAFVVGKEMSSARPVGHVDAERGLEDGDLSTLRVIVIIIVTVELEYHGAHIARRQHRLQCLRFPFNVVGSLFQVGNVLESAFMCGIRGQSVDVIVHNAVVVFGGCREEATSGERASPTGIWQHTAGEQVTLNGFANMFKARVRGVLLHRGHALDAAVGVHGNRELERLRDRVVVERLAVVSVQVDNRLRGHAVRGAARALGVEEAADVAADNAGDGADSRVGRGGHICFECFDCV